MSIIKYLVLSLKNPFFFFFFIKFVVIINKQINNMYDIKFEKLLFFLKNM